MEQVSSVAQRGQLEAPLDYMRERDQFVCAKLDRLARSVGDLLGDRRPTQRQEGLAQGADNVWRGAARHRHGDRQADVGRHRRRREAEREAMLERQRDGIAKAKREGRYKGRVPTGCPRSPASKRQASGPRKSPPSWG
jgi:hypothetical protein